MTYSKSYIDITVNSIISSFIPNVDEKCSSCNNNVESLENVFVQCIYATMFWTDFQVDLKTYLKKDITLKEHDFLLIFNNPHFSSNEQFVINLLIILAKFFIQTDLNIYFQTLLNLTTCNKK